MDLSRFDAAPLIAFTAPKETDYRTETDKRIPPRTENQKGTVFVRSNHFSKDGIRPIIRMALDAEHATKIWGRGWRGTQAEASLQHTRLDNLKLGDCYRGARIVLCDHMRSMREGGYVSNRIYDALACGAAVISDDIQGLPDAFEADVFRCQSTMDFVEAVREIEEESYETRAARLDRARKMHGQHSLFHRAAEIGDKLLELKKKGAS
jgi:spore maturation protein CgeB